MNSKKHLILTHPLWGNYGGMLQAYALWRNVSRVSGEVQIADYPRCFFAFRWRMFIKKAVRFIQLLLGCSAASRSAFGYFVAPCAARFKKLLGLHPCLSPGEFGWADQEEATWIVGSDQVWRSAYTRNIKSVPFFFLDFLPEKTRFRSIAYAASFGTAEWEGTPEETMACRALLRQFKAVSVRERTGVDICRDVFGVEAVQMPDPTLLAEVQDYVDIINSEKTRHVGHPYIAAYLLDEAPSLLNALQAVSHELSLPVQHLMPRATAPKLRERFPISAPQWLRYMKESEFVVTDSFHGCVFAIIFNKPFVCLGNEGRGSARFDTLLSTFGLESRLVTSPEQAVEVMAQPIDWDRVNAIHEAERARGLAFLRENLS